jgi:hypothetical protein
MTDDAVVPVLSLAGLVFFPLANDGSAGGRFEGLGEEVKDLARGKKQGKQEAASVAGEQPK